MGNSQSAQLHQSGALVDSRYKKEISRINKYASPEHKVLPGPIPGQKLKNTDNGNILLNGGTISGKKFGRFASYEDSDPEVLAILNRRSALVNGFDQEFQNSKRFHSDPDLAIHSPNNVNQRNDNSCPSKARINRAKRKKSKAPAPVPPPVNLSTLPRDLERIPKYSRKNDSRRSNERKRLEHENNKRNVSRTKSPAPKPPNSSPKENNGGRKLAVSATVPAPPPPPPPLPESFGKPSGARYSGNNPEGKLNNLNKLSYNEQKIENIKPNLDMSKQPSRKSPPNDRFNQSFQDDIKAAVQKRLSIGDESDKKKGPITPLKQYYFSGSKPGGQSVKDKRENKSKREENKSLPKPPQQYYFGANISAVNDLASKVQSKHMERESRTTSKDVVTKAIVERTFSTSEDNTTETKRFEYSPNQNRRSRHDHSPAQNKKKSEINAMHSWFDLDAPSGRSKSKPGGFHRPRSFSTSSSECDRDIRMDLRPIVPAKRSQNPPKFSPTQAWRSLSVDSVIRDASNEQSSDDTDIGESRITRSSRANAPIRRSANKSGDSGIFPDVDSCDYRHHSLDRGENVNTDSSNQRSTSRSQKRLTNENNRVSNKSQWTPEQDLSDDCSDSPAYGSSSPNQSPVMVNVQPKLVTSAAFNSMPYSNYKQYSPVEKSNSITEDTSMSPSEKVKEKSRRGGKRRSKSNKSSKSDSNQPSSLQNLKNSMKAALSINKKSNYDDKVDLANWSLSRSIPNSLNELELDAKPSKSRGRDPVRRSNKPSYMESFQDHPELLLFDDNYRSLPQLNRLEKAGIRQGHVVYLPEYKTVQIPDSSRRNRSKSKDARREQDMCDISDPLKPQPRDGEKRRSWFLTTMEKEMQERNSEKQPDWMRRVEEEFKSKRDREKANIRQQLRIFNLEHKGSNLSIDDTVVNSSDSHEPESPTFDYRRYRSRSEDGLTNCQNFEDSRKQKRSRSYHELREDPSGPFSMPVIPPPPPQNSLPPLDFFFEKKRFQDSMSTSSPTSSSHASYRKQDYSHSKGISKWFRKKPKDEDSRHSLNSSTRPDPEGCRSSSEENRDVAEGSDSSKKGSKVQEPMKRPSIYKQLNEIAEREEKLKEQHKLPSNDQHSSFSRLNSSRRMNSAGESYSESDDVEVRNSCENLSRPRTRQYVASKDSITSSEDGHAESGFYSSSDRKNSSNDVVSKRYSEYSGNYEHKKVPFVYAQPFTPSKGYRPVSFNPQIKPFVK